LGRRVAFPSEIAAVHKRIEEVFGEHVARVQEAIRQPSVSGTGEGIREMAELLRGWIEELGGWARVVPTAGHPVVYGGVDADKPTTLLVYSMYDVQPAEEPDWIAPPFAAEVVELPELGKCIVGRGATNQKGPLVGLLNACRACLEARGELPVNLLFVVEGEEELGSPHLPEFVEEHKEELAKADAMFWPSFSQDRKGKVIMPLGCKGIVFVELRCRGGAWGGPVERNLHSSHAAWVASPVARLVNALAALVDAEGQLQIRELWNHVRGPTPEEEALLRKLAESFDESAVKQELGIVRFKLGLHGVEALRRYFYEPSINIDGIAAGYVGPGTKTVLPREAVARLDVRLVPDLEPDQVLTALHRCLRERGFDDIEVIVHDRYTWAQSHLSDRPVQAMLQTYRMHGFEPEIWPRAAGAAPFYLFSRQPLNLPWTRGGLGHGGRAHAANEYCTVKGLLLFEQSMATFLHLIATERGEWG